ncbi:Protein BCCIP-like [Gracilariopsis chorda]|uniref:Protein BCCIP-like n=1 Tax=Gracilariopsis chorda TaxID=448386 RepID=A0A2V3J058_9FLOR|nr:Protein BCCIP-like [Gracilariopsis chorda]|eukprot:PXF47781.1 Protein BCCIP-like [Gracilariopsis chorda]
MGKRKRRTSKSKQAEANGTGKQKSEKASYDMDEECIHYHSSSDEKQQEGTKGGSEAGSDSELDESGDELMLTHNKSDESDVEVNVEFFDPREDDVGTICMFLGRYVKECTAKSGKKESGVTSARALSEAICKQTRVGTSIRLTDEEAAIGFVSCLNMRNHSALLVDLKRKLVEVAENQKEETFVKLVNKCMEGTGRFDSERMGLVLCERVVNLPPMVVPKILEALFCEIEWATEDESTKEQRDEFKFGWYMYITEVFLYSEQGGDEAEGKGKEGQRTKRQRIGEKDGEGELRMAFGRVEDWVWAEHAKCSIAWDIGTEEKEVRRKRMAMIVAAKKVSKIRQAVERAVQSEEAVEEVGETEREKVTRQVDDSTIV